MKKLFPYIVVVLAAASCSQDREVMHSSKPKKSPTFHTERGNPHNQQARRKPGNDRVGLGLDVNSRNPNKFRTVRKPKND